MNGNIFNNRFKLGAGDPYAASTAMYLAELASIERRILEIEQQILNPNISQSTIADMQNEKIRLMALKAAINNWLALSREQKNKVNGSTYVSNLTNKYLPALNKVNDQFNPGTIMDDLFNTQIAGMPLILAIGLLTAGAYFIYQNTRGKKA